MNQNTCKTCKWWDKTNTFADKRNVSRECHKLGYDNWSALDGSHCDDGKIYTGPDFGCIHYEETQEQLPQDHPGYARQQEKIRIRDMVIAHPADAHLLKDIK